MVSICREEEREHFGMQSEPCRVIGSVSAVSRAETLLTWSVAFRGVSSQMESTAFFLQDLFQGVDVALSARHRRLGGTASIPAQVPFSMDLTDAAGKFPTDKPAQFVTISE